MLDLNFPVHLAMSKPFYFIFALSLIFMTCHADNAGTPTICAPTGCGNGVLIKYPFWKRSNATAKGFCGYPEFGLNCSKDGQPIIQLISDTYFVTEINYDTHSITLVDIDVVNLPCPRAKHSVSLGNYPLSFSSLDLNISFYFNCSSSPSSISPISCLERINSAGKNSYVFLAGEEDGGYDWHRNCDPEVVVTVKHEELPIGRGLIDEFGEAMNKGFVLDWMKAVDCTECELSEGYCGFNETTKKPMCMCQDGRNVPKICNKGTLLTAY